MLFFFKFLKHGVHIASVLPSSHWLSQAALQGIDWSRARIILELGAGTGPITAELLKKARPDARVVLIERDVDFFRILCRRFSHDKRVKIVCGDVQNLESILNSHHIEIVDYVISGLPIPSFSKELQNILFATLAKVLPYGGFNQITELPLVYRSLYRRHFKTVKFVFEPRNIPPAGVYLCLGIRS